MKRNWHKGKDKMIPDSLLIHFLSDNRYLNREDDCWKHGYPSQIPLS